MEYIKTIDSTVEQTMSPFKKTFYLKGILHLILVLYAARLAPGLPREVLVLFENQYFKLFVFSLILWTAQFSPSTAILISIAFMVSMNVLNKKALWEFLDNIPAEGIPAEGIPASPIQPIPVSNVQSIEAVKVLANAAASPEILSTTTVSNVANIAAANVTTDEGANALRNLAEQAITPAAGTPEKIQDAVQKVIDSIPFQVPAPVPAPAPTSQIAQKVAISEPAPAPPGAGCFPIRRFDMSKVESSKMSDRSSNAIFEDQQEWSPSA
jgi:hypothetical protein